MVTELYTYTGSRLAQDVKDKFGDTGAVQITDAMILRWINNGIRAIVAQAPFLRETAQANILAGQSVYSLAGPFGSPRIAQFDSLAVNGIPLKSVPFPEWQRLVTGGSAPSAEGVPEFYTYYGDSVTIWPAPVETVADGLTLYYAAYPDDLAAITDHLTVPDRMYNALLDYVHAQALELNENFEGAQLKLGQHEVHLQRQFEMENRSPRNFYSGITYDPDDLERPYA